MSRLVETLSLLTASVLIAVVAATEFRRGHTAWFIVCLAFAVLLLIVAAFAATPA